MKIVYSNTQRQIAAAMALTQIARFSQALWSAKRPRCLYAFGRKRMKKKLAREDPALFRRGRAVN